MSQSKNIPIDEILTGYDAQGRKWLAADDLPGSGGGTTLIGLDERRYPCGRKLEDWPNLIVRWETPEAYRAA